MESHETSTVIEKALNSVLSEQEDWEEGDLLVEWAVIAYVANPNSEKGSAYPMFFSNGELPTYRARGLFTTGLKYLE
jgi:hypothetical protein